MYIPVARKFGSYKKEQYQIYKAKYGKRYGSEEEGKKFETFTNNWNLIKSHNLSGASYTMA